MGVFEKTVRDVAELVSKNSFGFYSKDLFSLIPDELLDRELTEDNLGQTADEIDEIRFQKERKLSDLLGFSAPSDSEIPRSTWDKLSVAINEAISEDLSPEQFQCIKEVRFLSNVAQAVLHY